MEGPVLNPQALDPVAWQKLLVRYHRNLQNPPPMGRPLGSRKPYDDDDEREEPARFPNGAEVEVCSNDEGYEGSFYEAIVERYLPSSRSHRHGRYCVVYTTLQEDGTTSPLREEVDAADVRPRPKPPAVNQPRREFALHDMVEAFHNDGWWAGVVCRVPPPAADDDGESSSQQQQQQQQRVYSVCFPISREVLEFDETRLRPRLVFRGQRWLMAAEAEHRNPVFTVGVQVEVSRSRKTFGEYWTPATILKVIDATSFVVRYENIRENGELLTEIMDAQYIRPRRIVPTDSKRSRFPLFSCVEAFHEGSWWPGVVLAVSNDKLMKKYSVQIKSHKTKIKEMDRAHVLIVEQTKLRPRFDWIGTKWVRCTTEKQINRGPQSNSAKRPVREKKKSRKRSIAALISSMDTQIRDDSGPSTLEKTKYTDAILAAVCPDDIVQIKQKPSSYPEETVKQPNPVLEMLSVPYKMPGELQPFLFDAFGQQRPQGQVLGIQSFNPVFSSTGGTKDANSVQEKQKHLIDMAQSQQKINPILSVGTVQMDYVSSQTPDEPGENSEIVLKKKRIVDKNAEFCNIARNDHQQHEGNIDGMEQSNTTCVGPINNNLSNMAVAMSSDMAQSQQKINPILSVGTVQKDCISSQTPEEPGENTGIVLTKQRIVDKNAESCNIARNDHQQHEGNIDGMEKSNTTCVGPIDNLVAMSSDIIPNLFPLTENCEANKKVDKGMADCQADEHVLQPDHDTPMVDFDAERSPSTDKSALTQVSFPDGGNSNESEHVDGHSESLGTDNLPFVKTSPTWAQFEAMEMFRKRPQRPNFHQFQHYILPEFQHDILPEFREGMSLGLMHCFVSLEESIKKLTIEDEKSVFENKMKGISSLEKHGFDVRHLRCHLEAVLQVKNDSDELLDAIKKKEAVERQIDAQIRTLISTVCDLDAQEYLFHLTTESLGSLNVNDAMEISSLKAEARELKHSYLSVEKRFADVVAAPWGASSFDE